MASGSVPAGAPVDGAPVDGAPVGGAPVGGAPVGGAPVAVRPAAHHEPLPVDHAGAPADAGTHATGSVTAVSDDDTRAARPVVRTVVPQPAARPAQLSGVGEVHLPSHAAAGVSPDR